MFPAEILLGAAILGALTLYALLGGADFGGGLWDLLAWGPRKKAQRALIARAIAPVWEVNHVWLILALVLLFTAFPRAFAQVGIGLHVPLVLFLLGIIGRGSAFAFRAFDTRGDRAGERWGLVFSVSSLLSPLLLGATVGALATGTLAWLSPFALATGFFALVLFAFLAAVYLSAEADTEDAALAGDFRRRALTSGAAVAALAALVLALSREGAPRVFAGLLGSGWALVLHGGTAVCALMAFHALWARRFQRARVAAAAQVALIVVGWGAAQYPFLIVPDFTVGNSAAHPPTLRLALVALAGGMAVLLPSLVLLFWVFKAGPPPKRKSAKEA